MQRPLWIGGKRRLSFAELKCSGLLPIFIGWLHFGITVQYLAAHQGNELMDSQ